MKRYGFRIGAVGVEFADLETRAKAIISFCQGSSVAISNYPGPRYKEGSDSFATYERETEDNSTNCNECKGVFSSETCTERSIPRRDYSKMFLKKNEWETTFHCDGCYAKVMKAFEVWKVEQTLGRS